MTIDLMHYVSLLIWVISNACWASGSLVLYPYAPGYEDDWTVYPLSHP